jgi:hypothetical protein
MEKAFWDGVMESMKQSQPDFRRKKNESQVHSYSFASTFMHHIFQFDRRSFFQKPEN